MPAKKKYRIYTINDTEKTTTYRPSPSDSRFDMWTGSEAAEQRAELNWFNEFRTPKISTAQLTRLPARLDIQVIQEYNLRTIDFGNWVSQFHRSNFNALLNVSLKDLSSLVGSNNLGKGILTIDWGGRGVRRALGVYKPLYKVINLRRHDRFDKLMTKLEQNGMSTRKYYDNFTEKIRGQKSTDSYTLNKKGIVWILGTSGFGSFAHEFGHFMDNVLYEKSGTKYRKFTNASNLFTGDSVLPTEDTITESDLIYTLYGFKGYSKADLNALELAFYEVFRISYFDTKGSILKPNKNLKNLDYFCTKQGGKFEYWGSYCECWARIFEGWVQYALNKKGIQNTFLVTPEKKFEVQVKVIDGREVKAEVGRKVYVNSTTYPKINIHIKKILNIFAQT